MALVLFLCTIFYSVISIAYTDQGIFGIKIQEKNSCNLYISSRYCRTCLNDVVHKLGEFSEIDTLFVVTAEDELFAERQHFLNILSRELAGVGIADTIFMTYVGDVFSEKAHTQFEDSCLNALFLRSTPLLFRRNSNCGFEFFGT